MYAVNDLSDAIDVTRDFLTPIHATTWIKLAVVVLFVTGFGFGIPTIPTGDFSFEEDPFADEAIDEEIPVDDLIVLAIVLVAAGFVLWLFFTFVGAIMEFVLIAALRTGEVTIRRAGRANFRRAMSLFVFNVLLALTVLGTIAAIAYATVYPIDSVEELSVSAVGTVAIAAVAIGLVYGVVMRLTTDFVVPVMLLEECGIRAGWSRFFRALKSSPAEYVVYLVLATIIQWVASIAIGILAAITFIVLLIPAAIVFVIALFLGPLAIPLLVVLIVGLVLAMVLVYSLYNMPVVVYIRYYALLLLGDTDGDLDLIPGQRQWVRAADDWDQDPMGRRDDEWRDPDDEAPDSNGSDSGPFDGPDRTSDDGSTDDRYGWETTDQPDDSSRDHGWGPVDDASEEGDESDSDDDPSTESSSGWSDDAGDPDRAEDGRDTEETRDTEDGRESRNERDTGDERTSSDERDTRDGRESRVKRDTEDGQASKDERNIGESQDAGVGDRQPAPEDRESGVDDRESNGEDWDGAYDGHDVTGEAVDDDRSWVPERGHGWGPATNTDDDDGGPSDGDPVDRRRRVDEDGESPDRSMWEREEGSQDRDPWRSADREPEQDPWTSGEADEDRNSWTPESPEDDRDPRSADESPDDRSSSEKDEKDEERGWRYRDDS